MIKTAIPVGAGGILVRSLEMSDLGYRSGDSQIIETRREQGEDTYDEGTLMAVRGIGLAIPMAIVMWMMIYAIVEFVQT